MPANGSAIKGAATNQPEVILHRIKVTTSFALKMLDPSSGGGAGQSHHYGPSLGPQGGAGRGSLSSSVPLIFKEKSLG